MEDPVENIGAKLVRQAAAKTNDLAGDGTTTSVVLAQGLITEGVKVCTIYDIFNSILLSVDPQIQGDYVQMSSINQVRVCLFRLLQLEQTLF